MVEVGSIDLWRYLLMRSALPVQARLLNRANRSEIAYSIQPLTLRLFLNRSEIAKYTATHSKIVLKPLRDCLVYSHSL